MKQLSIVLFDKYLNIFSVRNLTTEKENLENLGIIFAVLYSRDYNMSMTKFENTVQIGIIQRPEISNA